MSILRIPMLVLVMAVSAHGFATTAQQEKITACSAEATAKALRGDEREAFISGCLKAGAPTGGKATAQQEKMESCSADASVKSLKSDERKAFMNSYLKAGGNAKAMIQQEKIKTCDADTTAKTLKGDERKVLMSTRLKKRALPSSGSVRWRITPAVLSAPRTDVAWS